MIIVNQSIFGIEAPKFDNNGTEVLLDYAVVLKDEPEFEGTMHQSIYTGHRWWIDKGEHWRFDVMIHLFKYTDPQTKFDSIIACKNALVTLWPRRDRDPFKDSTGTVVKFKLLEVNKAWIDSAIYPDKLILKFESQDYIDISKQTYATLIDDLGTSLMDDLETPLPGR